MYGPTPHSSKRRAEEEPEGEQRITKCLARMRIGLEQQDTLRRGAPARYRDEPSLPPRVNAPQPFSGGSATSIDEDRMYIDDTRDKVYIHDLASEIAQIEADEPNALYLPDIDRKISAIPPQLLQNQTNNANTQLVLYQVPSSISVPEEHDHVRRAIIAARARAREEQAKKFEDKKVEEDFHHENDTSTVVPYRNAEDFDPDAMDIS